MNHKENQKLFLYHILTDQVAAAWEQPEVALDETSMQPPACMENNVLVNIKMRQCKKYSIIIITTGKSTTLPVHIAFY